MEQNASMALRLADRAYVYEAGEIVLRGTGAELQAHPEVIARPIWATKAEVFGQKHQNVETEE